MNPRVLQSGTTRRRGRASSAARWLRGLRRLATLTSESDIRRLVDSYSVAVDARDGSMFARLFTQEGVMLGYQNDDSEPGLRHEGRAQLETAFDESADHFTATFHAMTNVLCDVRTSTASGTVYGLTHHLGPAGSSGQFVDTLRLVRYADEYVIDVDGAWKFARREVRLLWFDQAPADLRWR